jgi:hypothetical protein
MLLGNHCLLCKFHQPRGPCFACQGIFTLGLDLWTPNSLKGNTKLLFILFFIILFLINKKTS